MSNFSFVSSTDETKPGRKFLNCDENFCFNDGICLIDENQRQFCACPKGKFVFLSPF